MEPAVVDHLYLHVPFCAHRCGYCDFVTVTGNEHLQERYVDALIAELGSHSLAPRGLFRMDRGWLTSGAPAGGDSVAKRISVGHLGETRNRHPAPAQLEASGLQRWGGICDPRRFRTRQTPRGILNRPPEVG
jgi:hypothetical protein